MILPATNDRLDSDQSLDHEKPADCLFCGGRVDHAYELRGRRLGHCSRCGTIGVLEMPRSDEIADYYQGFRFQADPKHYGVVHKEPIRRWMQDLGLPPHARMLDVGGGGGFFAKAFEDFGFGSSTYIDLDGQACDFARSEMGLESVICDAVENIDQYLHGQTFDFIYCRHVIEHLVDPVKLIHDCAKLLSPDGVFVLQCPNGTSKEGVLFPSYWMKFLRQARTENRWSRPYAALFSLSDRYGWGIEPIRHLWAISGRGIRESFRDQAEYRVRLSTASLADSVFSPYWRPKGLWERLAGTASHLFAGSVFEGMHLVVEIKRTGAGESCSNNRS